MMSDRSTQTAILPGTVLIEQVGFEAMPAISSMNRRFFSEDRVINRFDRPDLLMLLASIDDQPVGFKIGYGLGNGVYYSAKGGVSEDFRRIGVARALLNRMMELVRRRGYTKFSFDTFPNIHVGMTLMAIREGFVLTTIDYSESFRDYRFRFIKPLDAAEPASNHDRRGLLR